MDLTKHLDKAKDAVNRRNYKLAAQICSQLLGIQPDDGDARAVLRQALYKKAAAKPPSRVTAMIGGSVHLLTAAVSRMLKAHASAARAAERYLSLDPMHEGANLMLGESLERAGFKKSALAVYRSFAEAHPRCLQACRQAGALLYDAGEVNAAMEMYERALKVDPRDQESLKARKNLAAEGALLATGIADATSSRELLKDSGEQQRLDRESRLQLGKEEIAEEIEQIEARLQAGGAGQDAAAEAVLLARAAELRGMEDDVLGALDYLERAVAAAPERSDLAEQAGDLRLRLQVARVTEAEERGDESAAERATAVLAEMRIAEFRRRVDGRAKSDLLAAAEYCVSSRSLAPRRHAGPQFAPKRSPEQKPCKHETRTARASLLALLAVVGVLFAAVAAPGRR